ncbi:hypothetical protein PR048_024906 [Dryococelus australis]|uniref:Uncharacterized protein n=1 Tax=Dryococelus australis TaxID=614101 RepID=A0ABQ9GPW7_9NEOP|nr:hypothetical protein PR048_024906 [Dryococelus australis]
MKPQTMNTHSPLRPKVPQELPVNEGSRPNGTVIWSGEMWVAHNIRVLRVKRCEYGVAQECKCGGNGKSPRKPTDQRHRPARSQRVNLRGVRPAGDLTMFPLVSKVKIPLPPPLNPHPAILSGDRGADGCCHLREVSVMCLMFVPVCPNRPRERQRERKMKSGAERDRVCLGDRAFSRDHLAQGFREKDNKRRRRKWDGANSQFSDAGRRRSTVQPRSFKKNERRPSALFSVGVLVTIPRRDSVGDQMATPKCYARRYPAENFALPVAMHFSARWMHAGCTELGGPDAPMAIVMSQYSLHVYAMVSLALLSSARSLAVCLTTNTLDKIDVKHVYTEVIFAIGSQFIRHTLDDSEPIADFDLDMEWQWNAGGGGEREIPDKIRRPATSPTRFPHAIISGNDPVRALLGGGGPILLAATGTTHFMLEDVAMNFNTLRSARIYWQLRQIRLESPITITEIILVLLVSVTVSHHCPIGPYHTGHCLVLYSVHYWSIINQWRAELILTQSNVLYRIEGFTINHVPLCGYKKEILLSLAIPLLLRCGVLVRSLFPLTTVLLATTITITFVTFVQNLTTFCTCNANIATGKFAPFSTRGKLEVSTAGILTKIDYFGRWFAAHPTILPLRNVQGVLELAAATHVVYSQFLHTFLMKPLKNHPRTSGRGIYLQNPTSQFIIIAKGVFQYLSDQRRGAELVQNPTCQFRQVVRPREPGFAGSHVTSHASAPSPIKMRLHFRGGGADWRDVPSAPCRHARSRWLAQRSPAHGTTSRDSAAGRGRLSVPVRNLTPTSREYSLPTYLVPPTSLNTLLLLYQLLQFSPFIVTSNFYEASCKQSITKTGLTTIRFIRQSPVRPSVFVQLDEVERGSIDGFREAGWTFRRIARNLNRTAYTVGRRCTHWENVSTHTHVEKARVDPSRKDRSIVRQGVSTPWALYQYRIQVARRVGSVIAASLTTSTITTRALPSTRDLLQGTSSMAACGLTTSGLQRRITHCDPRFIAERHTAPERGVMVWGAISYNFRNRPQNGHLSPAFVMSRCFVGQQDPHTSRTLRTFGTRLDENFGQRQLQRIWRVSARSPSTWNCFPALEAEKRMSYKDYTATSIKCAIAATRICTKVQCRMLDTVHIPGIVPRQRREVQFRRRQLLS